MDYKKLLSLVMIYMIISLTLISSIAFAEIYGASVTGKDGAAGAIRTTDTLVMNSSSTLPVSADYKGNGTFEQMNCDSSMPVSCALTGQISGVTDKHTVVLKEYGSEQTKTFDLYVDNKTPTINTLQVSSLGWGASAYYIIRDTASDSYPNKCSGIEKVELVLNGKTVKTASHPSGVCVVNGTITGTINGFVGEVNVSLVAYDYMDYKATKAGDTVFIEATPPKISTSAKVYRTGTTDEIKAVSLNSTIIRDVDIEVSVEESDLNFGSARGDFKALDKTLSEEQSDVQGSCQAISNNKSTCIFQGIKLLPSITNPTINISVSDNSGNVAYQAIKLSFTNVNNAGSVTFLGTEGKNCINNAQCYVRAKGAEIIAIISSSSSFYENQVQIQGASASCEKNTSWVCKATVNLAESATKLLVAGTDDLGNQLTGEASIIVDPAPPKILGLEVKPTNSAKSIEELVKGDSIRINLTAEDKTPIIATADFREIGGSNSSSSSCTTSSSIQKCEWTSSILEDGFKSAKIPIELKDATGQITKSSVTVGIKQQSTEVPDLWKLKSTTRPSRINNRLLIYYPKEVFAYIKLESKEAGASISGAALGICMPKIDKISGNQTTSYGLTVLTPKLVSISDDKTRIVASIEIPSGLYNITTLYWNCSLKLKTYSSTKVYDQLEVESYNLNITLDSSKLMSDNVNEEITLLREWLNSSGPKTIRTLDKWVTTITEACGMLKNYDYIATTLGLTEIVLSNTGAGKGAAGGAKAGGIIAGAGKAVTFFSQKICPAVSCDAKWNKLIVKNIAKLPLMQEYTRILDDSTAGLAGVDWKNQLNHKGNSSEDKQIRADATTTFITNSLNPQDSYAAAVLMLCPSGILHNMKKEQSMKCEKLRCLEQDVPAGLSATECERAYKYNKCTFVTGNIGAFPFLSIFSEITKNIKNLVTDPLALGSFIITTVICKWLAPGEHGICMIPKLLDQINKITALYSAGKSLYASVGKLFNSKTGAAKTTDDLCTEILADSAYLQLPYDVRNGQLNGKSIANVGSVNVESNFIRGPDGITVKTANPLQQSPNEYFLSIQGLGAQAARLSKEITSVENLQKEFNQKKQAYESGQSQLQEQIRSEQAIIDKVKAENEQNLKDFNEKLKAESPEAADFFDKMYQLATTKDPTTHQLILANGKLVSYTEERQKYQAYLGLLETWISGTTDLSPLIGTFRDKSATKAMQDSLKMLENDPELAAQIKELGAQDVSGQEKYTSQSKINDQISSITGNIKETKGKIAALQKEIDQKKAKEDKTRNAEIEQKRAALLKPIPESTKAQLEAELKQLETQKNEAEAKYSTAKQALNDFDKSLDEQVKQATEFATVMQNTLTDNEKKTEAAYNQYVNENAPEWVKSGAPELKQAFSAYYNIEAGLLCSGDRCIVDPSFATLATVLTNPDISKALMESVGSTGLDLDYTQKMKIVTDLRDSSGDLAGDLAALGINPFQIESLASQIFSMQGDLSSLKSELDKMPDLTKALTACAGQPAPCSITNTKELQELRARLKDKLDDEMTSTYWKGTMQGIRSAAALARGVHQLSVTLFPNGLILKGYTASTTRFFNEELGIVFNTESKITEAICTNKLDQPDTMDGFIMGTTSGGIRYSAAHVEAEAEPIINYSVDPPKKTGKYKYVITAGITNGHPAGRELTFSISLDNGAYVVQEEMSLPASESYRLNEGGGVIFEDSKKYNKVCIEFKSSRIEEYFDTVIKLDDNKLCNNVNFYGTN